MTGSELRVTMESRRGANNFVVACPVGKDDTTRNSGSVKDCVATKEKNFCHAQTLNYKQPPKPAPEVAVCVRQKIKRYAGIIYPEVNQTIGSQTIGNQTSREFTDQQVNQTANIGDTSVMVSMIKLP